MIVSWQTHREKRDKGQDNLPITPDDNLSAGAIKAMRAFFYRCGDAVERMRRRGRIYRNIYPRLRLHESVARHGGGFDSQAAVLPRDISGLVARVVVVRTHDIVWGGRPARRYRRQRGRGLVIAGGDWDMVCKQDIETYLDSYSYSRSIRQLFVERLPIERTDQYALMAERVARGRRIKGCRSLAEIDAYFARLFDAYRSIATGGYKSQVALRSGDPYDEITVYVDRKGELQKQHGNGHHRLAMARLLGIERVPVCIGGVHQQWARRCFERFGRDVVHAVDHGLKSLEWSAVRPVGRPVPAALPAAGAPEERGRRRMDSP